MSLKDDINGVKKELGAEESFLESFLKVEKFYKKNKTAIFGLITATVIGVVGFYTYSYLQLQEKIKVNIAFNKVLENPSDEKAMQDLKTKSEKLYQVTLFMQKNSAKSDNEFLNQLSLYTEAISKNTKRLNKSPVTTTPFMPPNIKRNNVKNFHFEVNLSM